MTCTFWLGICQSVDCNHRTNPILLTGEEHNISIAEMLSLWILFSGFIRFYISVLITFLVSVVQSLVYCLLLQWLNFPSGINKVNHISSHLILSHIHGTPSEYYRPASNKLAVSWCLLALKRYHIYSICFAFSCQERQTLV